jgi:hypothetical protein
MRPVGVVVVVGLIVGVLVYSDIKPTPITAQDVASQSISGNFLGYVGGDDGETIELWYDAESNKYKYVRILNGSRIEIDAPSIKMESKKVTTSKVITNITTVDRTPSPTIKKRHTESVLGIKELGHVSEPVVFKRIRRRK